MQAPRRKSGIESAGRDSCSVSLLTNSMGVEGTAAPQEIIRAVEEAGYGASKKAGQRKGSCRKRAQYEEMLKDKTTPLLKKRLMAFLILIPLMYFSMGHMMWGLAAAAFFEGNHIAMGLVQLLFTVAIMVINQKFFISGFKSLSHRARIWTRLWRLVLPHPLYTVYMRSLQ